MAYYGGWTRWAPLRVGRASGAATARGMRPCSGSRGACSSPWPRRGAAGRSPRPSGAARGATTWPPTPSLLNRLERGRTLSARRPGHRPPDRARRRDRARERVRDLRDRRADQADARAALEGGGEGLRRQDRLRGRAPGRALRRERDGPRLPPGHGAIPGARGDRLRVHVARTARAAGWLCKHVAATLYGVGVRLDEDPELLFRLRRVAHADLVARATAGLTRTGSGEAQRPPRDRHRPALGGLRHRARGRPAPRAPARPAPASRGPAASRPLGVSCV